MPIDSLLNYMDIKNVSLCLLLSYLDITDIVKHVECHFYSDKDWNFKYAVEGMIKLAVVKFFRQLPYRKVVISEDEAYLLGFREHDGIIKTPSGGALHHFVKTRLGIAGADKIMMMVGKKIAQLVDAKDAKLDSTPIEASRYNKYCDYNPHYGCKMDKAHITMIGTCPVFMNYTGGNEGDSPQLPHHINALLAMNANIDEYYLDGSYDSFQNHADIWCKLGAKLMVSLPINAVMNGEGEVKRLNHWVNKKWMLGGSKDMNIDAKLKFLYENGRQEQVGVYLRNQNLANKSYPDSCRLRSECERVHSHIKSTVKFYVRNVMSGSRELYTKFSFVSYQLLILPNLKNRILPVNSFENYI